MIRTAKIVLSGSDSINFAYSLYRPSAEMIAKNREILNRINSSITINRNNDGFDVKIEGLGYCFNDTFSKA